jgi:predicted nucleic-acid-binding protein
MAAERALADTNLFLRYLTNDVPRQASAVEALLRRAQAGDLTLVVTSLIIAEIVWTLESHYHLAREDVRARVEAILNTPGLEVAESDLLLRAIRWYGEKNVDFIDAYNAAWLLAHDIPRAFTFDRKHFARIEGLEVVVPGQSS